MLHAELSQPKISADNKEGLGISALEHSSPGAGCGKDGVQSLGAGAELALTCQCHLPADSHSNAGTLSGSRILQQQPEIWED